LGSPLDRYGCLACSGQPFLFHLEKGKDSMSSLPDFINALLEPSFHGPEITKVEIVQTHISYVLLAGDQVYKIKKPVDFGFLDFTTLAKRCQFCEQELVLNQRLCPQIYLDVVAITREEDGFSFNGKGEVVDYAVRMKRMPEEKMMGRLLADDQVGRADIDRIIAALVSFYQNAASGSEISGFGSAEAVGVNVLENFEQTLCFIGSGGLSQDRYDLIKTYASGFLKKDVFARRAKEHVKDCHGDLYSANICLADPVYIFDCIEFNERFRYCDVASDIAFLAMDLDFHGQQDLSAYFIDNFVAASGDAGLGEVLNFYKCYRAYVRGKIGLFTAHAPEVDDVTKEKSLEQAASYFELAAAYAA